MNYYVLCPYGLVTGGPDALHQMVFYLNYIGRRASLVYLNIDNKCFDIPEPYKCYISSYKLLSEINDDENNVVIIPEFLSFLHRRFNKAKVYIWWLSVYYNINQTSLFTKINLLLTYPLRALKYKNIGTKRFNLMFKSALLKKKYSFKREKDNVYHLCASFYAYDYVINKTSNSCRFAIEPISKIFLDNYTPNNNNKKDIVIYNPKKSKKYVECLKKRSPQIKYIALEGLTQKELIYQYKNAKVYIDFGPFPGAERMPKEAVINGCAIITGKKGASAFYDDVMITDDYKFDDTVSNIDKIIDKIEYIFKNYDYIKQDFKAYIDTVLKLETNFIDQIRNI